MNKPLLETIKEVGRWGIAAVVSWVITETAKQLGLVPEVYNLKIWVFTYTLPIRAGVGFGLTIAGRAVDKYVFTVSKEDPDRKKSEDPKGVIPF